MTCRISFAVLLIAAGVCAQRFSGQPSRSSFPSSGGSNGGCALIIPGPGSDTCITFDAVNSAFNTAVGRVGPLKHQGEDDDIEEKAGELGLVLQEASRILASQYSLSKDAISQGLPLIDTTKTVIDGFCPEFFKEPKCEVERYRSMSGVCNNLDNPLWGKADVTHQRFIPPNFADGISAPRVSVTGAPLPSPRLISRAVHTDDGFHDHAVTIFLVFWGQFIDHDITLTSETKDPVTNKTPKCCEGAQNPACLPIEVPADDGFFSKFNQRCINLVRSPNGVRKNCALGTRSTFNVLSSIMDGNTVYSNSEETLEKLRSFKGGEFKMLPVFEQFRLKPLLPLKLEKPNQGCIRPGEDVYCFLAGEPRVNENTALASIHTLMVRAHNTFAHELAAINPHWSDETIFQEVRHINVAVMQHVTYNEFLPMVLGKEIMEKNKLILLKSGYLEGYDSTVDPTSSSVFAQAVFRFGHTLLPSTLERWSKTHRYVGSQRLHELLQQPYDLYKGGWIDSYIMGMINQVAQAYDNSITQEVTDHLFQEPGKDFGLDLAALNLQRAREHGIPGYSKWREFCGLRPFKNWDDLHGTFNNQTVNGWRKYYAAVEDIDLWSAGVSEKPLPGSMVGPTFGCLMAKQFHNLRFGDRFWYENGGWPSSFTLEQLAEIRKIKLSRIICDNTDEMDSIQVYSMVLPDHEINPRVPCKSGILPKIDLTKWRDASFHSSPGAFRPF
jgi:hypothetical protein